MTAISPWNVTLEDFTCSSTQIKLTAISSEQRNLPSMVKLIINGTTFDFAFEEQTKTIETVDATSDTLIQAEQSLQFDPPITLPDGFYPVSISFQLTDEIEFSYVSDLEPINLIGCVATNSEDSNITEVIASTWATSSEIQTQYLPSPTSTQLDSVTTDWVIKPFVTSSDDSLQAIPTLALGESTDNNDDTSDNTRTQDESHIAYTKSIKSAVPAAILFSLLGLIIFFMIRRYRKLRMKKERSSFYVYDNEFNTSEEGRC
ncbi:uncharacterized protein FA14DRAFT_175571 [Meira miltonrushii]|uniref:Uncharacterized protein n=1 Tax=Meira miltonrushii TaxID=1280837 RepID=A0A316V4G9_9BASI|nr:uncharacterized protein FA14DRAFT_175571 [Meira miltonrushii]PWN31381.1 hypothetical protein FA14DRAFT_175571 [Meira miltonrushii]